MLQQISKSAVKITLFQWLLEEPSKRYEAASKGAKVARIKGGFEVTADESYSIGQISLDTDASAIEKINNSSNEIIELANSKSNTLSKMGKGAKGVSCKNLKHQMEQC